ncbi:SVEP1 protein, partial [Amia calva]|nr:SVEP1 protein [Amia calva]
MWCLLALYFYLNLAGSWPAPSQFSLYKYPHLNLSRTFQLTEPRKLQESPESKVERLGQLFKHNVRKLREKSHSLDLVFLVDESSSVGNTNFLNELKFVKKLLSDFPVLPSATRVAIVTFSSKNNVVPKVDYISSPQSHQHKCSLFNQEIPAIKYRGGGTYTKGAFQQAAQILRHSRQNATKVIFLITDGYSNGGDPRPTAASLREMGVEIFTFGIWQGNIRELNDMASHPKEEHCYLVHNFAEFEALARRALHEDLPSGNYFQEDISRCSSLCEAGQECCDVMASCQCGTHTGQYDCICEKGHYGKGLQHECTACPSGTYKPDSIPGGISTCISCPDKQHTSQPGSTSVKDCVCKDGYSPVGKSCDVVHCPEIHPPENGFFIQNACNNHFNAACGIRCKPGFDLVGSSIRLCQPSGEWSGSDPSCRVRTCPRLREPEHGHINCSAPDASYRTVCDVNCEKGYRLEGSKRLTCQVNAQWSWAEPRCVEIHCPPLKKPKNVFLLPPTCGAKEMKTGTVCQLRCPRGYRLSGGTGVQCLNSGKWSDNIHNATCRDTEPPQINCPKDIMTETMEHHNSANVSWIIPSATDNSGEEVSVQVTPIFIPPHLFPIGNIRITYMATDSAGNRANCSFNVKVIDVEAPVIDRCRSPPPFQTSEKELAAVWEEPQFSDNSGAPVTISNTHSPGALFPAGDTVVQYTATDASGNNKTCDIHIIIRGSFCDQPFNPVNGEFSCMEYKGGVNCTLYCNDGYSFTHESDHNYFCAHDGMWNPSYTGELPDCSLNRIANHGFKPFEMLFKASRCDDDKLLKTFTGEFYTALGDMVPSLCSGDVTCTLQAIPQGQCLEYNYDYENGFAIGPGGWGSSWVRQDGLDYAYTDLGFQSDQPNSQHQGSVSPKVDPFRRKRHRNHHIPTRDQKIQIVFNITASVPLPSERNDTVEAENQKKLLQTLEQITNRLKRTLNKQPLYTFRVASEMVVADTKSLESQKASLFCRPGSVLKGRMCVNCPVGTYFSLEYSTCESCWIGSYQDEEGQMECKNCPSGFSTVYMHSRSAAECKEQCKPGSFSVNGLETCESCPLGTHQSEFGSKVCLACPGDMSTVNRGAVDVTECGVLCPAGQFSRTGLHPCYPCPRDYYQPDDGRSYCLSCPFYGTTTITGATAIQDCSTFFESKEPLKCDLILHVVSCLFQMTQPIQCEMFHECFLNPCQNRGTCEEVGAGYICLCPSGFTGRSKCESDINECDSAPCLNGALCKDGIGEFVCQCQPGYVGMFCEAEVNECSSFPCLNDGTCVDEINRYSCSCADGFTGVHCELEINECLLNPCENNATCENLVGSFSCTCPPGFSGEQCEININECTSAPCLNGATCWDDVNDFRCQCPKGYTGKMCEVNVDECNPNPCLNGASCVDGLGLFRCRCLPGFNGTRCETEMSSKFNLDFEVSGIHGYVMMDNIMPSLTAITCTFWMKSSDSTNYGTPISYAVEKGSDNAFLLIDYNGWVLYVNGKERVTDCPAVNDGRWHHIGVSWNSADGDWKVYIDGIPSDGGKGLSVGTTIPGGGALVLGQDQDQRGEGFNPVESFVGSMSQLNIWDHVLTPQQIQALASSCPEDLQRGNLLAWPDFLTGIVGRVKITPKSMFCADCPVLESAVSHLRSSSTDVKPGSQVDLFCDPGFYLVGEKKQRCLNRGEWSHPLPQCNRVTCGPPSPLEHGFYLGEDFQAGSSVTYQCNSGFYLLGDSKVLCGNGGSWSGHPPACLDVDECALGSDCDEHSSCQNTDGSYTCTCIPPYSGDGKNCTEPIKCKDPGTPEFGHRDGDNYMAGSEVVFTCKAGYELIGASQIRCSESGTWNQHAPNCKALSCGRPPIPENAIMKGSNFTYGSKVTYSCTKGFFLSENAEIYCLANLSWSQEPPMCESVTCGEPPHIQNANFTLTGQTYLSNVSYECSEGYRLQGSAVLACEASGDWTTPLPVCEMVSCGDPPVITNATVIGSNFTLGSKIYYTCKEGYTLIGLESKECLPSGEWSQSSSQCVPRSCGPPPPLDNAVAHIGHQLYLDKAIYYCTDGYSLADNSQVICNAQGQWTPPENKQMPHCIADFCQRPPDLPNAILDSTNKPKYPSNSVVSYKCKEGFVFNTTANVTCVRGGQWTPSPLDIQCIPVRCSKPSSVERGYISGTNYNFGAVVAYSCDKGFYIKGEKKRTCEGNGEWSGNLPSCQPVSCGKPPSLKNGFIKNGNRFVFESQVTYACDAAYALKGSPVRVCQANRQWFSDSPPSCVLRTCEAPPTITNGHYRGSTFEVGSKVEYVCDEGYDLKGDAIWTCLKFGNWSKNKAPACTPVQCPEPPLEENHLVLKSIEAESGTIELSCDDGYVLHGSQTLRCTPSQEWNDSFPVCKQVSCGPPPEVSFGEPSLAPSYFGSSITYFCMVGFTLRKEPSVTCQADGTWSTPFPECIPVECLQPEEIENGIVDVQGLSYPSTAQYNCKPGYHLVGNSTVLCGENGLWIGGIPECKPIECTKPKEIANGKVSYSKLHYGHAVAYTCHRGYHLEGPGILTCLETGQWDAETPFCKEIYCSSPQGIENGFVEGIDHRYGSTIIYSCFPGFQLSGHALQTCEESGWSSSTPVCLHTDCGLPPHIDFGEYIRILDPKTELKKDIDDRETSKPLEGLSPSLQLAATQDVSFLHGTMIVYSCNVGYELIGYSVLFCQEDGLWNDTAPVCLPAECEPPHDIENGFINLSNTMLGSLVQYSCDEGYELEGQTIRQCISGRQWSDTAPTCKAVSCGEPEEIANGSFTGDIFTFMSIIYFECDQGFHLEGSKTSTCQANKKWDAEPPKCIPVSCGLPLIPENGTVAGNEYTFRKQIEYSCNAGFVLIGEMHSSCLANGSWSHTAPVCRPAICTRPPDIPNGEVLGSVFGYKNEVTYRCREGYTLQGKSKLVCQGTGVWDSQPPRCIVTTCDPPDDISHGFLNGSSFNFGDSVEYICFPGYEVSGNPILQCSANGSWVGTVPSCQPCVCQPPAIQNGYVTGEDHTCGNEVHFRCQEGFKMLGPASATCESGDVWSPGFPLCGEMTCASPPLVPNAFITGSSPLYPNAITYRCKPGFELTSQPHVNCKESGVWSEPYPTCEPVSCGRPPVVSNSQMIGDTFTFGHRVQYRCLKGYELDTKIDTQSCLKDGTWSTYIIKCRPTTCPIPKNLANMVLIGTNFTTNSSIALGCVEGFQLLGPGGSWAPDFSSESCVPVSCGKPTPPLNSMVMGTRYSYRDSIIYRCHSGYELQGNPERICQSNKLWSGEEPLCVSVSCESPTMLLNGKIQFHNLTSGSAVEFHCNEGYELQGEALALCLGNKSWSSPFPTCAPKPCPAPPGHVEGGSVPEGVFFVGQEVSVSCPEGYQSHDTATIVCKSDQTWTSAASICKRISCGPPRHVSNALLRGAVFQYGDVVMYSCYGGYMMEGPSRTVCLQNGTWTPPPACKAVCWSPCQNGGICQRPNACLCSDGWMGRLCEERKLCSF